MIRLLRTALVLVVLGTIWDVTAADPPLISPPGYTAVRIYYHFNRLAMDALVNGKKARVAIDTGASLTAFDEDRARNFDIAPVGAGFKYGQYRLINQGKYPVGYINNLQAGLMDFGSGPIVLLPLFKVPRYTIARVEHIDAIVGTDILIKYKAIINCDTKTAYFKTRATARLDLVNFAAAKHFVRAPMRQEARGDLTVTGFISGHTYRFEVDTGAPFTLLSEQVAKELGARSRDVNFQMSFVGETARDVKIGKFTDFTIGDFHVPPQDIGIMVLPELTQRAKSKENVAAILGFELLAKNRAIIDFDSMNLFFE